MRWPLGDSEHHILTELGDADLITEKSKRYVQRHRSEQAAELGYDATLPLEIPEAAPGRCYSIPFSIADDIAAKSKRIRQVALQLVIKNLVSADRLEVFLNGESISGETCLREFSWHVAPYEGQKLEFHLERVQPIKGRNLLEVSLEERPEGLTGGITIEQCELLVEYGVYPSSLAVS
jgi:hypothetical protein